MILVRGDSGLAVPEMYEYCEKNGLFYAFGYRHQRGAEAADRPPPEDRRAGRPCLGRGPPEVRRPSTTTGPAPGRDPRRILAKVEANRIGTNRRFVVTNLSGDPQGLYHGFYVQRGDVPEKRIGELKNHLDADRLSSHGFTGPTPCDWGLHAVAFAVMVLFREACAEDVPELARAEVGTIRQKVLKVGARVRTSARRIWFHLSTSWPSAELFRRVCAALDRHACRIAATCRSGPPAGVLMLK